MLQVVSAAPRSSAPMHIPLPDDLRRMGPPSRLPTLDLPDAPEPRRDTAMARLLRQVFGLRLGR